MPRAAVLPSGLTARREAFCAAIAEGLSGSDAYRLAFDAERYGPNALAVAASRLLDVPKVALRITELRAPQEAARVAAAEAEGVTAGKIVARAWQIGSTDARDRVPALAVAAKGFPELNASRQELSGPAGGPIPVAVMQFLATLTPEQLAKLASGETLEAR